MPALFQAFNSHPMARNATPHGMRLVSCGKSRQMFVNGCDVLKGLKTEASTVACFCCLAQGRLFHGFSWFLSSFPITTHPWQPGSRVSLLFIPPGSCKTFQGRGGAAQRAVSIGSSQAPPRLLPPRRPLSSTHPGPPILWVRNGVTHCDHPLVFLTHWRTLLVVCPLVLRLLLNSKSLANKTEQTNPLNNLLYLS